MRRGKSLGTDSIKESEAEMIKHYGSLDCLAGKTSTHELTLLLAHQSTEMTQLHGYCWEFQLAKIFMYDVLQGSGLPGSTLSEISWEGRLRFQALVPLFLDFAGHGYP